MRWRQTLQVAFEAVRLNRLRSALTVLGIMIGIASVTLTIGLGLGAQQKVAEQINALGSNLLIVSPGSSSSGGFRGGFGSATTLTRADAEALADQAVAPSIAGMAPVASTSQGLTAGTTTSWPATARRFRGGGWFRPRDACPPTYCRGRTPTGVTRASPSRTTVRGVCFRRTGWIRTGCTRRTDRVSSWCGRTRWIPDDQIAMLSLSFAAPGAWRLGCLRIPSVRFITPVLFV